MQLVLFEAVKTQTEWKEGDITDLEVISILENGKSIYTSMEKGVITKIDGNKAFILVPRIPQITVVMEVKRLQRSILTKKEMNFLLSPLAYHYPPDSTNVMTQKELKKHDKYN